MTVCLDHSKRLILHRVGEEMEREAIRSARIVAAEHGVDVFAASNEFGRAQVALGVAPILSCITRSALVDGQAVYGDSDCPETSQQARNIGIEHVVVDRV